jgi:ATP-dependent helicase/nuclease subunit B
MPAGKRVFTIPPGAPFLPTLADALVEGRLVDLPADDGLGWADVTIYLPTRRAALAFTQVLRERRGERAQLLPRIIPLGEADETEFDIAALPEGFAASGVMAPPIAPLERRLILTRLIQGWARTVDRDRLKLPDEMPLLVPASPADAVALAASLETLMDAFSVENVGWDSLGSAVESDYSRYFEITLEFLRIAAEAWPKALEERGRSDPAHRRTALIGAEAERLHREKPRAPLVAAGSTGSMPSTAALIAAIAALPNGAVVLPGLDRDLDEAGWRAVSAVTEGGDLVHGHPQAMLRRLLDQHLRLDRRKVLVLGSVSEQASARAQTLSQALRPAETTDSWSRLDPTERAAIAADAAAGLRLVEASDERDEALCAAIALRETLATRGRTAALVTPDRSLARRVAAELTRWGVTVDDSAGVPLSETSAGRLARLAADAAASDFEPTRVLALLAHPQTCLGWARAEVERASAALEIGVLRGPAPAPGLAGLRLALERARAADDWRAPRPRKRLTPEDWSRAAELVARLQEAFAAFSPTPQDAGGVDLIALTDAHRAVVDRLRQPDPVEPAPETEDAWEALDTLFDELSCCERGGVSGRFADYPGVFAALAGERTVRPRPGPGDQRVTILGLLEARLLDFDRVVLGGLDEGVWPPRAQADCFLNRPMRVRMGLGAPERRIGLTAHDLVQALGAHDAVLTRALKRDGSPMVPSRFLQRLKAFVGETVWSGMLAGGERYRRLARLLDTPRPGPPLPRPAPKPDPALFPRRLSVTEVETLVRDPYSIFAKHVLALDPLDRIAAAPSAAGRGTLIHDILGTFSAKHADALPDDAHERLMACGRDAFREIAEAHPGLHAEWWLRFERLATAFIEWEAARRPDLRTISPECSGELKIRLADGTIFILRARADRIEARHDGGYAIVDFKTGAPPSAKEVFAGFSPQLTLEAVMLMRGGFPALPAAKGAPDLLYVHTAGGRSPLTPRPLEAPRGATRTVTDIVEAHGRAFETLIGQFVSGEAAYLSRPFPKFARRFSPYDHLARVKEWSLVHGPGEDGA